MDRSVEGRKDVYSQGKGDNGGCSEACGGREGVSVKVKKENGGIQEERTYLAVPRKSKG